MKLIALHTIAAVTLGFLVVSPHIGLNIVAAILLLLVRCMTMCYVAKQTRRHMIGAAIRVGRHTIKRRAPAD